jgi:hypothetical protein
MGAEQTETFKILGVDNVLYGPVELPVLVAWVKEDRVLGDTWIHVMGRDEWHKARNLPELTMFFQAATRRRVPAE